jgi:hypothetical protein
MIVIVAPLHRDGVIPAIAEHGTLLFFSAHKKQISMSNRCKYICYSTFLKHRPLVGGRSERSERRTPNIYSEVHGAKTKKRSSRSKQNKNEVYGVI